MLKKVDFPLTNAQISAFVLDQGYTTYFTSPAGHQSELLEAGPDPVWRPSGITSQYRLTPDGDPAPSAYFHAEDLRPHPSGHRPLYPGKTISWPSATKSPLLADYYKNTAGEYSVHCEVKENTKATSWISPSAVPDNRAGHRPCATTGANAARKSTNTSWGHYLQNRNPNKKMPGISWKALPGVFLFMYPLQILLNLFLIPVSAGAVEFGVTQFFGEVALAGEVFGEVVGIFVADAGAVRILSCFPINLSNT